MSSFSPKRPLVPVLFAFAALVAAVGMTAGGANAQPGDNTTNSPDSTRNAFAHLNPVNGAPSNGGTVAAGTKFTLDLLINAGSNPNITAAQSYLTFDTSMLQVVSPSGTGCTPAQTLTPDNTTFDALLQNELCNGPNPCDLRGVQVPGGTIAYASGALNNFPNGTGGDFRVASLTLCATNGGRAVLHWQFSPPAPTTRDSEIIDINSEPVQQPSLYQDYVINISGPTATPGPPTFTPVVAATPVASCTMNFSDVPQGNEFYTYIKDIYCRHAVSGYSDGFHPYALTMRAQLAKIVVLGFNLPTNTSGGPHFNDVPQGNEFYNYVETAANKGIISGYDGRLFKPWDNVKRGQIAKIVVKAANIPITTTGGPHFSDVPQSNVFYDFVETAYSRGMISGIGNGRYGVDDFAKRGQICKIVSGALR